MLLFFGEARHLVLQCCKVGLVFEQEGLTAGVGVGKIGYIGFRTGIVDAGMSKCSFLVVQGLHGVGGEYAEVRPGVLVVRLCIPSANLQGELGEQLHVVNAFQNCRVHIESKLGITEFFNVVVLAAKILANGAARVVMSIKDGGNFADIGSAKRGEAFFKDLEQFKSRGLICIFVVREEVFDNSVRDRINDVKDTSKIDVRVVCEVGGGLVVLGLGVVDFGNALSLRRLEDTR